MLIDRKILCIDLKSFFAFVECVDRGFNAFKTPLVVASIKQRKEAISLAVTPYLKSLGLKGRMRLYDIPKDITYFVVNPRMKRHVEKSKEIINIYLDYVSEEDLHIYSIDECFLDVTDYLDYYQKDEEQLAEDILKTIFEKTKLVATCGIGPNMLLAKLAMDIEAKKNKSNIAYWTYEDIPTKLWPITDLSSVWQIGKRLEKRLLNMNIHSIYDLAHTSPKRLQKNFGKMGLLLFEHANGIDNTIIKNIKTPTQKSLGHSQVLYKDYYNEECLLIIKEMLGRLTEKLRLKNLECQSITLFCSYSKVLGGGFSHSLLLDEKTDNEKILFLNFKALFDRYYEMDMPVRKIGLHLGRLESKKGVQLDLFYERKLNDEKLMKALDIIHQKFGKNSLLYATSLLSYSTEKEQNQKLGGHHV